MRQSTSFAGYGATALALFTLALATPAQAQFGGLFNPSDLIGNSNDDADADENSDCETDATPSAGRRILGGLLGGVAGDAARSAGIPIYVPVDEFADQLSTAIACRLDPQEQRQAADATLAATRGTADGTTGAQVGATSAWVSETRPGVSGRSTVVGRETAPGQSLDCIMVTDVVIVNGEETTEDKRMCRRPPSPRYAIVA